MSDHSLLVIGCGSIGERHVRCFQNTGRTRVVACDTDAALLQRVMATYHVTAVSDWKREIDSGKHNMVLVATPAHLHVAMALYALEHRVHVMVEKPLAPSISGIAELQRAQTSSRCKAAVAYVYRVFPFLRDAHDFVREGTVGAIRQIVYVGGQPFHKLRPEYARTYYNNRATGGGAIQDALTHLANWVESLVGPTNSVLCDCAHLVLPSVTVEDTVHVSARNGDVLVNYSLNQFQNPNEAILLINGTRGSVRIEFHHQRWGALCEGDKTWNWRQPAPAERDTHFIAQANAFVDLVEGKPSRLCTLDEAIATLRFNLAALASSESAGRINCASFIP